MSLGLDSMHLRPEERAPRDWVYHWVQDSEPSTGPGTGVTEETDHAGYCGGSKKQGCSHEGKPQLLQGAEREGVLEEGLSDWARRRLIKLIL